MESRQVKEQQVVRQLGVEREEEIDYGVDGVATMAERASAPHIRPSVRSRAPVNFLMNE